MAQNQKDYVIHPQVIAMSLLIAGVTFLFLAFSGSYIYTRVQADIPPIKLPTLFYINTLVLLASSHTITRCKRAYREDDTKQYQLMLAASLALSLIFLVAQIFAWIQLFTSGILVNQSNTASFVYLISAVHFAHVIAGIPFLGLFLFTAYKRMKEPVSVLVYFSDPEKSRKLRLLTIYWHFLDALWIYLVIFFAVNYYVFS